MPSIVSGELAGIASQPRATRQPRGFTLVELAIVVLIISVLAAIALPAYTDSVRKSRRGLTKAALVDIAQRFERFHTVNNTYIGAFALVVPAADRVTPTSAVGARRAYTVTNPVITANTFTLTATPLNEQVKDVRCMTLTLNQAGVKTESGTGVLADCW